MLKFLSLCLSSSPGSRRRIKGSSQLVKSLKLSSREVRDQRSEVRDKLAANDQLLDYLTNFLISELTTVNLPWCPHRPRCAGR